MTKTLGFLIYLQNKQRPNPCFQNIKTGLIYNAPDPHENLDNFIKLTLLTQPNK